jgi:cytochrome c553
MDETPEELAEIKREAERIDPHKYRRRYRVLMTLVALAFCVAVAWVAITMAEAGRNPCERVRDYYCKQAGDAAKCDSYHAVYQESVKDESPKMRGVIRDQCVTKINRLKEEEGITVE